MATPEYLGGSDPAADDDVLPLLHRIAGGLFDLLPEDAEMSDLFPEGNEPLPGDDKITLLKKAASSVHILAEAGLGGGGDVAGFATGDMKHSFASAAPTGWLLCDGKSIGSATSGAELKSAQHEALFLFLWNNMADGEAHVNEGRGASAAADWAANKSIFLPDTRSRFLLSKDLPGETGSLRITEAISGIDPSVLGASGGQQSRTLTTANLPSHTHEVGETSIQTGQEGFTTVTAPGSGSATGSVGQDEEFSTLLPCITVNTFIKL